MRILDKAIIHEAERDIRLNALEANIIGTDADCRVVVPASYAPEVDDRHLDIRYDARIQRWIVSNLSPMSAEIKYPTSHLFSSLGNTNEELVDGTEIQIGDYSAYFHILTEEELKEAGQ